MTAIRQIIRKYGEDWIAGWNRFWFSARDPAILGLIRLLTGCMLFYTHLVWTIELNAFFGVDGVLPEAYVREFFGEGSLAWTHLFLLSDLNLLLVGHLLALVVFACFAIGLWTRVTSILAALLVISYANRAYGALFGLDQINGMLALYLAIGPSGRYLSVDWWLQRRRATADYDSPSIMANLATRLIQVHLCVVYLFAGLGKLLGEAWWDGEAMWGAIASYDYQTLDLTFLVYAPLLINLLTHVTLAWEVSYAFLVWPRLTRPIMVVTAILVHLGIGICMGMITFGIIMIVANLAFLPSSWVRAIVERRSPTSPSA